jgi:hypothetical protein
MNTISVPLSGVAATFSLSAAIAPSPAPTMSFTAATSAVISAPGQNAATTYVFSYLALDADGNVISTSGAPLANPLTLKLTEHNVGTGKNAVTLSTIGVDGLGASGSLSATSMATTDTFSFQYDGAPGPAASPYYVTMASSASLVSDPNELSTTPAAPPVVTINIDPLYLAAGTLKMGDTFATPAPGVVAYPTLTYGKQTGSSYSTISIMTNSAATGTTYSAAGIASSANACTGFAFPIKKAPTPAYNATFTTTTPVNGSPCVFGFGDGESTIFVNAVYQTTSGGGIIVIPTPMPT